MLLFRTSKILCTLFEKPNFSGQQKLMAFEDAQTPLVFTNSVETTLGNHGIQV